MVTSHTYRGVLVPADNVLPITEWAFEVVADDRHPENLLRAGIAEAIHCQWVECVNSTLLHDLAPSRYHTVTMVIDEEGAMAHSLKPVNSRAWAFYPNPKAAIHGDAIFLGQDRSDPEEGHQLESLPVHITAKFLAQKITEIQR